MSLKLPLYKVQIYIDQLHYHPLLIPICRKVKRQF